MASNLLLVQNSSTGVAEGAQALCTKYSKVNLALVAGGDVPETVFQSLRGGISR